jgi:signal transduction histidine kinase
MIVGTVQDLKNEIGRLQTLLDDFHALSHPQQVQCALVDLAELVRNMMALLLPESLREKVKIVECFDADVPAVLGDADKLKQVFLNLIKNSFEAMPCGGTLTARCYARATTVRVEIADSGIGIPPDLDVFDLFRSTKSNGTGLGLAIARQIVQAHGGTIEYSSAPGAGTTFRVVLPAGPS